MSLNCKNKVWGLFFFLPFASRKSLGLDFSSSEWLLAKLKSFEKRKGNKGALLRINLLLSLLTSSPFHKVGCSLRRGKTHWLQRRGRSGHAQPPRPPDESSLIMGWHLNLSGPLVRGGKGTKKRGRKKKVRNWRVSQSDQSVPSVEGGPLICIYRPGMLHRLMI